MVRYSDRDDDRENRGESGGRHTKPLYLEVPGGSPSARKVLGLFMDYGWVHTGVRVIVGSKPIRRLVVKKGKAVEEYSREMIYETTELRGMVHLTSPTGVDTAQVRKDSTTFWHLDEVPNTGFKNEDLDAIRAHLEGVRADEREMKQFAGGVVPRRREVHRPEVRVRDHRRRA